MDPESTPKNCSIPYIVGSFIMGLLWIPATFGVTVAYAAAEDPPRGEVHVPWWLLVLYNVMRFPAQNILPWGWMRLHFGERPALLVEFCSSGLNGALWGLALVFISRRIIRKFNALHRFPAETHRV